MTMQFTVALGTVADDGEAFIAEDIDIYAAVKVIAVRSGQVIATVTWVDERVSEFRSGQNLLLPADTLCAPALMPRHLRAMAQAVARRATTEV